MQDEFANGGEPGAARGLGLQHGADSPLGVHEFEPLGAHDGRHGLGISRGPIPGARTNSATASVTSEETQDAMTAVRTSARAGMGPSFTRGKIRDVALPSDDRLGRAFVAPWAMTRGAAPSKSRGRRRAIRAKHAWQSGLGS